MKLNWAISYTDTASSVPPITFSTRGWDVNNAAKTLPERTASTLSAELVL